MVKSKKTIFFLIIVAVLGFIIYQLFLKKEAPSYTLVDVKRGTVSQEVSETGQIKKGDKINVGFKNPGRIEKIFAEVGEDINKGDTLAKLETADLIIQLKQAEANLALYQAQLNKLEAGATPEEIKEYQTAVANAETAFQNAVQKLADITAQAEDNMNSSYEDALIVINDSYLKAYNAYTAALSVQKAYFNSNDLQTIMVVEARSAMEASLARVKVCSDSAQANPSRVNIDSNLAQIRIELNSISNNLRTIRETCEDFNYVGIVSSTNKTSLDTQRTNISAAITDLVDAQQTIISTKLDNEYDINVAKTTASSSQGSLVVAQNSLNSLIAPPRTEDVSLYQAQVDKAQAEVDILKNKIYEASLRSPVEGQITEIKKRAGELVQSSLQDSVFIVMPAVGYEIKADIYEEDVVKMSIGNEVGISLIAFPGKTYKGKVVSIDPAEKIIDGVVYYETIVNFDDIPEEAKPGMTVDLVFKTASKENVLMIPQTAVRKKEGRTFVEILQGKAFAEKEVVLGLSGKDEMVEIVSGLSEGEKVILR
jgi:multidrug efflux pump subunit AcrA (membrane-fusion protein)